MEKKMSAASREEYLRIVRARYPKANRAEKARILTEGCAVLGIHRKSLIRALNRPESSAHPKCGHPAVYDAEVLKPLKDLWKLADYPCSKRLQALLPLWLPHYERHEGALDNKLRTQLLAMSPATMDRWLQPLRARRHKGLCGTTPAKLQGQIPIRTRFQEADGPGWIEADTVAHCGESLAGSFIWSLTLTDIDSGWTENGAVWNKEARRIVKRMKEIEDALPFDILGFDSDNGSEFLNWAVFRYFHERPVPVDLTRSRPYRKNDNAHVEQKQWTHVRQLLGYDRLDDPRLLERIHTLYRGAWRSLQNFFLPTMQLISKSREDGHLHRYHSKPKTPYQRLQDSPKLSVEQKDKLRQEMEALDPIVLRRQIETQLREIFRLLRRKPKKENKKLLAA
jgi:hypothetical protein